MTCSCCELISGIYDTSCLECCARLVATASPDKAKAMTMLAVIAKNKESPKREAILSRVKEMINE